MGLPNPCTSAFFFSLIAEFWSPVVNAFDQLKRYFKLQLHTLVVLGILIAKVVYLKVSLQTRHV